MAGSGPGEDRISYLRLATCPTVLGLLIAGWGATWSLSLVVVWVPAFMEKGLGYSVDTTKWLVAATWLGTATVVPLCGWLSQYWRVRGFSSRITRGIPAVAGMIVSGILSIIGLRLDTGLGQVAIFAVAFAIGGIIFTLSPTIVDDIVPLRQRGALLGIVAAIQSTGGLIAPSVTGHIIAAGATPHDGYVSAFMLAAR